MSTRGDLTVTKKLVGDCYIDNEICAGDDIVYEVCIENTTSEEQTIQIFDDLDPFTMAAFSWVGMDENSATTAGSAGGGADPIDETLILQSCARFVYTITVTTKEPFCGVVRNCVRYCTPDMKRPKTIASPPVYVGILESETCLDHDSENMNEALWEFMPQDGRAHKLQALIESGYDLLHIFEALGKLLAEADGIKLLNEDYVGFLEKKEEAKRVNEQKAAAEARRQAAVAASADTAARAAE